jgi:UDP-N-acetylmuramoylalanine--D-glutamate ligase
MRHRISWADLAGRDVVVWGCGAEGASNQRALRALGVEPVLVDDRPDAVTIGTALPTDGAGIDAMLAADVVVKSPGIPRRRDEAVRCEEAGVPVVGGLGLWLESVPRERVLCITGTKGKSTTTAIASHLAARLGLDVVTGGNIGAPPWDPDAPAGADLWVIEVSSYQATDVASSPPVVAVTSLAPDHLPWHGGVEAYYRDKLSLCAQPGARLTVAGAASPDLVAHEIYLGPEVRWIGADSYGRIWTEPLGLLGDHNLADAQIARTCLAAMGVPGADDDGALRLAAEGFAPLAHRLERVAAIGAVEFYDDGLSTNVLPTVAALEAFPGRKVALIAGGADRGIDYTPLAEALAHRDAETLVCTVYATGPYIQEAVAAAPTPLASALPCVDLVEAVGAAAEWAAPDGVVLLSPAAASFDAFTDYRHRSQVFRDAAAALGAT